MTPTRLYHFPTSRSTRALWTLEEIGEPYDVTEIARADMATEEYRARHPLGRTPVIEDDAGSLFESGAIVLALADRHPAAGLNFPLGTRERELVYQWVLFAVAELDPWIVEARDQREKDAPRSAIAGERVGRAAAVVEEALRGVDFIVGGRFTVADIMLESVLAFARRQGLVDAFPQISRYIDALAERPTYALAMAPAG